MRLYWFHGRLKPDSGGTDLEGNEIDDWGFDGGHADGCVGPSWTYGNLEIHFEDEDTCTTAQLKTGWQRGVHDYTLEPMMEGDCLKVFSPERNRWEYFGDWGVK